MAYVNSSRAAASLGLGDRFGLAVKAIKAALNNRAIYNQTVRELNGLSDRELNDLGIHRSSIASIAHEAAYGN